MFGLNKEEIKLLSKIDTPRKIQNFINSIPMNFEDETLFSPRNVLKNNRAQCIEGAILAALILRIHGFDPLLIDLTANKNDDDHVIAVFKQHNHWGAISKTNHVTLRYREPVYRTVRELVMSYFHEYFTNHDGKKNLRSYSNPVDLKRFDKFNCTTSREDIWYIAEHLVKVHHFKILNKKQASTLRKADNIEIESGKIIEWKN